MLHGTRSLPATAEGMRALLTTVLEECARRVLRRARRSPSDCRAAAARRAHVWRVLSGRVCAPRASAAAPVRAGSTSTGARSRTTRRRTTGRGTETRATRTRRRATASRASGTLCIGDRGRIGAERVGSFREKNKKIKQHELLMKTSIFLSLVFLVMYILYHMTTDPTPFGGEGFIRYLYFFILITHITLSVFIVPMVLITYVRAISKMFDKHKKIARITFPIWLYIAVTGVIVFLMISPYYTY